jgi:hypothetical protein
MADFPSLEPDSRAYDFGTFAASEVAAAGGGMTRFGHSALFSGLSMQLDYVRLPEASMQLLRDHYATQNGDAYSFVLPAIIWRGQSTPSQITLLTTLWKYAGAISETHQGGGYFDATVPLMQANGAGSGG